jgi:hypothetical protein
MTVASQVFGQGGYVSSSRGRNGLTDVLELVGDHVIKLLSPRATSNSQTVTTMPTHGTLLRQGTAASASPTVLPGQVDVPLLLADIKRITGFSWEKIGGLLSCTRQTVYNWTQGEAIKSENVKQVVALHETLTHIDRGSQSETAALLETTLGGRSILDMIACGEFTTVRRVAGRGPGRPTSHWASMERQPSGRQDHWTDRIAAEVPEPAENGAGFDPGRPVRKAKFRIK